MQDSANVAVNHPGAHAVVAPAAALHAPVAVAAPAHYAPAALHAPVAHHAPLAHGYAAPLAHHGYAAAPAHYASPYLAAYNHALGYNPYHF